MHYGACQCVAIQLLKCSECVFRVQKKGTKAVTGVVPFQKVHIRTSFVTLGHKTSRTSLGIFVAIGNNTLYGSKLLIFLLWQNH